MGRNVYYISLLAFALSLLPIRVQAQELEYTINRMEVSGGNLNLDLLFTVSFPDRTATVEYMILPVFKKLETGEWVRLPEIRFQGKTVRQREERKKRFGQPTGREEETVYAVLNAVNKGTVEIEYRTSIPFEPWMKDGELWINGILFHCSLAVNLDKFSVGGIELPPLPEIYGMNLCTAYAEPVKPPLVRRERGAALLDFPVGSTRLLSDFGNNRTELAQLEKVVASVRTDLTADIQAIEIVGYASPDGPYDLNERLSAERARAFGQYLIRELGLDGDKMSIQSVAEDWDGVIRYLERNNDFPFREQILEIIHSVGIQQGREGRIMKVDGGRPYIRMREELFPSLRRVEYAFDYTVREYSLEEAEQVYRNDPGALSPYDIYRIARRKGIETEEGQRILIDGAAAHPDDPALAANAAAVLLDTERSGEAVLYLNDDELPQMLNNRAVYLIGENRPEEAESLLEKSAALGCPEARQNLEEIVKWRRSLAERENANKSIFGGE